eukprot:3263059-Rhodomonas_salina.3
MCGRSDIGIQRQRRRSRIRGAAFCGEKRGVRVGGYVVIRRAPDSSPYLWSSLSPAVRNCAFASSFPASSSAFATPPFIRFGSSLPVLRM